MKKGFLDFFPPPQFLETPYAGFDISDDAVRFIEFTRRHGHMELTRYGEKVLPSSLVEAGYIRDEDSLAKILAEIKKEFQLNYVRVALPDEKTYLFKAEVPKTAEDTIRQSIEFTIEDNVPVRAQEAVFDYEILPGGNQDRHDVIVSVVPREVVDVYLRTLKKAGLVPLVFGIESDSIAKAVVEHGDMRVFLIVNLEKDKTGLYIVSRGVVHFTSIVPSGLESLKSLWTGVSHSGTPGHSFSRHGAPSLVTEIEKVYDYWSSHKISEGEEKNIEEIIICGGSLEDAEQVESIGTFFKTKARIGNVWTNASSFDEFIPDISFAESLKYASAIGLALPPRVS